MMNSLTTWLNRCLPDTPETKACLNRLSQKTLALTLLPFNRTLYVQIEQDHCRITNTAPEHIDVTLSGTPFAFMGLARGSEGLGNVHMTGNAEIGIDFRKLLDPSHLDWEEGLSMMLGDIWAYRIMEAGRKSVQFIKRTTHVFGKDLTEYVQEEAQLFPSKHQLETFYNEVIQLSHDAERLKMRINKMK